MTVIYPNNNKFAKKYAKQFDRIEFYRIINTKNGCEKNMG